MPLLSSVVNWYGSCLHATYLSFRIRREGGRSSCVIPNLKIFQDIRLSFFLSFYLSLYQGRHPYESQGGGQNLWGLKNFCGGGVRGSTPPLFYPRGGSTAPPHNFTPKNVFLQQFGNVYSRQNTVKFLDFEKNIYDFIIGSIRRLKLL